MSLERKIGLDLVRSIAILCVVLLHLIIPYGIINNINTTWIPIPDGVDIFFVLSGFLIGSIVIKTFEENDINRNTILEFWIMRWFRTLPNYYLFTFIVFVIGGFHLPWRNLFFLQNLYKFHPNPFLETWRLCVEEWFYLLFPFGVFIFYKIFFNRIFYAVLFTASSMIIFSVLMRLYFYFFKYTNHSIHDFMIIRSLVITRFDAIAFGILGAILKYYKPVYWNNNKKFYFTLGMSGFIFLTFRNAYVIYSNAVSVSFYNWNFDFIFYALFIIMTFPFLENISIQNKIIKKFVTNTSLISYSMYLIHNSILFHIMLLFFQYFKCTNYFIFVAIYIPLLYFLCNLNYRFFEIRFINYRKIFIQKYLR